MLLKICTQWDIDKRGKLTKPDYPKKNFGLIKKYENVVKMTLFRLFIENGSNDFSQNAPECRTNQFWAPRENRMSKKIPVLKIFIHKVYILAKNGKVVSKESPISQER